MFSKENYLNSMAHEVHVLKHLFGKLPEGAMDYRPTPGQRSTRELLQYIPVCISTVAKAMVAGSFEPYRDEFAAAAQKPAENFPHELDARYEEFKTIIGGIPEEDFASKVVTLPNGMQTTLGQALVNMNLKFMAAYRMQFFLYLKAVGRTDLGTMNLWAGTDPPAKS